MKRNYPNLFSPLRVKNIVFKNRIFSAPTMMCMAFRDGTPSPYMMDYFTEKAKGGCAMVTLGDTPVDEEHSVTVPRHIIPKNENINMLAELAYSIKSHGAVASFELNHNGRAAKNPITGAAAWGPVTEVTEDGQEVLGMDEEMMNHVANRFADCARIIKTAGWDMCMLHGGHGWLLGQFLSPATNRRADKYGGSLENRAKFPIMVIDRVRQTVGDEFIIDYRISGDELQKNGLKIDECIEYIKMIENKIDMIHVSAGLDTATEQAIITHPNSYLPNGCNVRFAEAVKKSGVRIPVTTVGAINTPEMAEEIIANGKADAVAMARTLIADPYWPEKVREGRLNEIRHCIRCTNCLAEMHTKDQFHCDVNPLTAHEYYMNGKGVKAEVPKTVYIIGGGPGGMTAAITAAERGHRVTLFEQDGKLGGVLNYTDDDLKFKLDLNTFKNKLVARTGELPITVRLNTKVTRELLSAEKPDAVFIAIGADPIYPPIPGLTKDSVIPAFECYSKPEIVGKKAVLIGGGLVGAEAAIYLANLGRDVTVVEMIDRIAAESNFHHRTAVHLKLKEMGVRCLTNTKCIGVEKNGVKVTDGDGKESFIEANTVLLSAGYQSRTDEVDAMLGIAEDSVIIGDCKRVSGVRGAVHDGFFAAMNIK